MPRPPARIDALGGPRVRCVAAARSGYEARAVALLGKALGAALGRRAPDVLAGLCREGRGARSDPPPSRLHSLDPGVCTAAWDGAASRAVHAGRP